MGSDQRSVPYMYELPHKGPMHTGVRKRSWAYRQDIRKLEFDAKKALEAANTEVERERIRTELVTRRLKIRNEFNTDIVAFYHATLAMTKRENLILPAK